MEINGKQSLSVIIPVYNAEKHVHRCVDSVLKQSLKDIEIILVDDGSTDGSAKILDEYAQKHKNIKVIHQKNSGPAAARNSGLEIATGKYIGFVDSDDYISPDMYESLYNSAVSNNVDIVISDFYTVTGEEKAHSGNFDITSNKIIDKEEIRKMLTRANEIRILWFPVKSIYKTDIIKENKIFFPNLKLGEETVFILDYLLLLNSAYYINKPFYFYQQTPNSLTRIKYKENLLKQLEDLYFAKKEIYSKHKFELYEDDLNSYTMAHTLPMLISNELNHKIGFRERIKTYKKIRNSEMIQNAYRYCSIKLIKSKLKYPCFLLKYRMYGLMDILMNIR